MKRSEMLNILTVKLLGLMVNEYGVGMKMAKDDAEEILATIERAGMAPPKIYKVASGPHEYHDEIPWIEISEWEPEDGPGGEK